MTLGTWDCQGKCSCPPFTYLCGVNAKVSEDMKKKTAENHDALLSHTPLINISLTPL